MPSHRSTGSAHRAVGIRPTGLPFIWVTCALVAGAAQGLTNVSFRQADARSLDPGRLFDAAVGRFVLMFMPDPTGALRLFAGRVRPGGILATCEPSRKTWLPGRSR